MKKIDYLNNEAVHDFVHWLAPRLNSDVFSQSYRNRRNKKIWSCHSIYDAFEQYEWRFPSCADFDITAGHTFAENKLALAAFQAALREAVDQLDDALALKAARAVVSWGGVSNGNITWLNTHKEKLALLLMETRDILNSGDLQNLSKDIRFTAGMTKIYALLCDGLVIYDSRVAAALGWLVVTYCQEKGLSVVPELLRFPFANAKEGINVSHPKNRCPNVNQLTFHRLTSGASHARWNVKASWLLAEVLRTAGSANPFLAYSALPSEQLRALEAALFMIGYDLGQDKSEQQGNADQLSTQSVQNEEGWIDCYTPAKGQIFLYRLAETGIQTKKGDGSSSIFFSYDDMLATLLKLKKDFGAEAFPLSNSAHNVPEGTAQNGLGMAYYTVTRKSPPFTSRLAAVLEDMGIFIAEEGLGSKHWRLNLALFPLEEVCAQVFQDFFDD